MCEREAGSRGVATGRLCEREARVLSSSGYQWECVRIYGLYDKVKRVSRLIIHPRMLNLWYPPPTRTQLPSIWQVVSGLFGPHIQRQLWVIDGSVFFYQFTLPAKFAGLMRTCVDGVWYAVTRLLMGATMSVLGSPQPFLRSVWHPPVRGHD